MNAIEIIAAWNAMTPEEQINYITACTFKVIKTHPTGTRYEINELVNEAWLRITDNMNADKLTVCNERRAAQGKAPTTLMGVVYRAVRAGIAAISYSEKKHNIASVRTVMGKDGQELDVLEAIAAKDNTEAAAILQSDLQRFIAARDTTDQQIIAGRVDGLTEREISAVIDISNVAVHKRIVKLQTALRAAIF